MSHKNIPESGHFVETFALHSTAQLKQKCPPNCCSKNINNSVTCSIPRATHWGYPLFLCPAKTECHRVLQFDSHNRSPNNLQMFCCSSWSIQRISCYRVIRSIARLQRQAGRLLRGFGCTIFEKWGEQRGPMCGEYRGVRPGNCSVCYCRGIYDILCKKRPCRKQCKILSWWILIKIMCS